ncbi:uncharacterized protein MELLADRAFT_37207 [Melampsora larici-populina 98AG31]|uniref:Nucleolar protein 16 n=1 Tax=Melampsora larici-populina (strain 98AG31 / pathotype 3-4-7) TaxID=747676 RepID=F4RRX0_MELLP|nr:uncharacterized protein MELLADRAFT_37207 [Melampsora larici-populina 98AG31]EGG04751.1 hypothetical protein MELLADRAFT_37207 [Melampsora larici-populina 98AG31]
MANPRQRRKARSSNHKVRVAKHVNSRLKKVTQLNFPAGLAELYNRRQTPTQNYRRLGLLSGKLDPRLSEDEDESVKEETTQIDSKTQNSSKLAKGEGRIIRDADGKIIKVILGGDEDVEIMNNSEDPSSIVIQISTTRSSDYANVMKNKQFLSDNQVAWIVKMIEKHGVNNVSAMAKDLKLNTYQKTEGEIRHMISRVVK